MVCTLTQHSYWVLRRQVPLHQQKNRRIVGLLLVKLDGLFRYQNWTLYYSTSSVSVDLTNIELNVLPALRCFEIR
jgi:cell division protein FtsB